jgi:hypothetical protein
METGFAIGGGIVGIWGIGLTIYSLLWSPAEAESIFAGGVITALVGVCILGLIFIINKNK